MVCNTQDNGSNAVEGDTEDDSSVTNRQQIGSNEYIFSGCKLHFVLHLIPLRGLGGNILIK
jgi:hypothetical protein